jgi:hypothetical protein
VVTLDELADSAARASDPARSSRYTPRPGGVDPLGLRQINFDLMDEVLPGINNVAAHIRPFTVVPWAWRRAAECARDAGKMRIGVSELQDFVDRVEVLYAWSQFLRNPDADLPGQDVLAPIIRAGSYVFGGEEWRQRQERRKYSTSLSAPINYGPALKSLGWLVPDPEKGGAMIASPAVAPALAAFEAAIGAHLDHPAFRKLGEVEVSSADVRAWANDWPLENPTAAERSAMIASLLGERSALRPGSRLIRASVAHLGSSRDVLQVRRTMCGAPSNFRPAPELQPTVRAWRAVQIRQVFRLCLEAMFHWCLLQLDAGPRPTKSLVRLFLEQSGDAATTNDWFGEAGTEVRSPADWIESLEADLAEEAHVGLLPALIRKSLAAALIEAPGSAGTERHDRLPLARASREANGYGHSSPGNFLSHVFESWIFGQHVYWAVGRGLADARARDKTILRLKIIYEESGWTLAPGVSASASNAPRATPDRLKTALSLLREAAAIG